MPITWDAAAERYFQQGVDRGVLYIPTKSPVPWNGLIGVDESGGGSSEIVYRDGKVVLADIDASDFSATISALFYPDELSSCLGMPEVAENLYVDNQKPTRFNLSYRSLIGSGTAGDMFGYQIHLVYNCLASIGGFQRKTLSDQPTPMTFQFAIVCTPVKLAGYRPSAHYILDTRGMLQGQIDELEGILYGVGATAGRMPLPTELFDLMNFGLIMKVHDEGGNVVSIKGASQYFTDNLNGAYTITNMNAVDNGAGSWSISDGANTVIVP